MADTGARQSGVGVAAPIWQRLRFDAKAQAEQEPALSSYLNATVLNHETLAEALCYQLAQKAGGPDMSALQIREICEEAYKTDPAIVAAAERDLKAVLDGDPYRPCPCRPTSRHAASTHHRPRAPSHRSPRPSHDR